MFGKNEANLPSIGNPGGCAILARGAQFIATAEKRSRWQCWQSGSPQSLLCGASAGRTVDERNGGNNETLKTIESRFADIEKEGLGSHQGRKERKEKRRNLSIFP
jgi:hypothetical protein